MNGLLLATLAGASLGLGCWALAATGTRPRPRLADALELLDGRRSWVDDPPGGGWDRVGAWLAARLGRRVSAGTRRRLAVAGRSPNRHYALKATFALIGLALPFVAGWLLLLLGWPAGQLPALAGLALAGFGFWVPDLALRRQAGQLSQDAAEALLSFFDLVILERLANQSGSQALRQAAGLSDVPVFVAIRDRLELARLEQRPPYLGLRALGRELELPALVDLADVMSLEESGAALAGALRARVRELRDAHLAQTKVAAAAGSERMAVFMVIPSLIFGLFFLVPPVLRLVGA